jgi:uncharacterized membrane protein (Fun14 family)
VQFVSTILAICVGVFFVGIQIAASMGILTVNWSHLEERVTRTLDTNKDGYAFSRACRAQGMREHAIICM